jgi:hypothetical protein
MKQLELNFVRGGNQYTQISRNGKAAIYRVETVEGNSFVTFEVFAIRSLDGEEVYPTQTATSKWLFSPTNESRANMWFNRLTNGEVSGFEGLHPVTGLPMDLVDERSIDDLPDVNPPISMDFVQSPVVEPAVSETVTVVEPTVVVTAEPVVEADPDWTITDDTNVPVSMDVPVDPTVPEPATTPVVSVVVAPTVPKVVKVKKPYVGLNLPQGEWTRTDFAILNGLKPANSESYGALMREVKAGRVVEVRKDKSGKGKPKSIYTAVPIPAAVVTVPVVTDLVTA